MLANAVVVAAIIALTITGTVSATYAAARAAIHRTALRYADAAFGAALGNARDEIAASIAASRALPAFTPSPPQPACAGARPACAYYVSRSISLETTPSAAGNLEADANVNENRVAANITVTILTPDGTALAVREKRAILRTFQTPPYAVIAGTSDGSSDLAARASQGDDGGLPPSAENSACTPSTTDETVVRAEYYNDASGACTDASTWRSQPGSSPTPSAWTP